MAILLPITLGGCQLLGGSTQVRFTNATSAFTLASIQLGSLIYNSPLSSGSMTGYYAVSPGRGVCTAQSQAGQLSNGVLLTVVAGHSYTVSFAGSSFSAMTVTMAADN
jgi:hypothetical protein